MVFGLFKKARTYYNRPGPSQEEPLAQQDVDSKVVQAHIPIMMSTTQQAYALPDEDNAQFLAAAVPSSTLPKRKADINADIDTKGPPIKRRRENGAREETRPLYNASESEQDYSQSDVSGEEYRKQATVGASKERLILRSPTSSGQRSALPTMKPSRHKRFDDEDVEDVSVLRSSTPLPSELPAQATVDDHDSDYSDDDAPEAITTTTRTKEARATDLKASQAIANQKAVEKTKRRNLDRLLKQRAKSVKRQNQLGPNASPKEELKTSESYASDNRSDLSTDEAVASKSQRVAPTPLPEDILAADPVYQPPTHPLDPNDKALMIAKRRKLLDVDSKPPKDIKRGKFNVRVLNVEKGILPPKPSKASKHLRESWLIGRRGSNGRMAVPRHKPSTGFLRQ